MADDLIIWSMCFIFAALGAGFLTFLVIHDLRRQR